MDIHKIVSQLGGCIKGDYRRSIRRVASLPSATPYDAAFVVDPRYWSKAYESKAGIFVTIPEMEAFCDRPAILTEHPVIYVAQLMTLLGQCKSAPKGEYRDPLSSIDPTVQLGHSVYISSGVALEKNVVIGDNVYLGPGVTIMEGSSVGNATEIYANSVIYPQVYIGASCLIHAGTVIGSDGFRFENNGQKWVKIPQVSGVMVGDDCEIGANCSIDCGSLDPTILGQGIKLDNHVHVGHNVHIGDHTAIAAGVVIGGSSIIGRFCRIGGLTAIKGHLTIGDYATVLGASTVIKSVPDGEVYSSFLPALPHRTWLRVITIMKNMVVKNKKHKN